jgi:hypothetical protein
MKKENPKNERPNLNPEMKKLENNDSISRKKDIITLQNVFESSHKRIVTKFPNYMELFEDEGTVHDLILMMIGIVLCSMDKEIKERDRK